MSSVCLCARYVCVCVGGDTATLTPDAARGIRHGTMRHQTKCDGNHMWVPLCPTFALQCPTLPLRLLRPWQQRQQHLCLVLDGFCFAVAPVALLALLRLLTAHLCLCLAAAPAPPLPTILPSSRLAPTSRLAHCRYSCLHLQSFPHSCYQHRDHHRF